MTYPVWYRENVNFNGDREAYQELGRVSQLTPGLLHRAARYYNHAQSSPKVQAWTKLDHESAEQACMENRWSDAIVCKAKIPLHANHRELKTWLARYRDLLKPVLAERDNPITLRKVARNLHQAIVDFDPGSLIWLGDQKELDGIARFDADGVQSLLAALGLWHFGEVSAGDGGAILRITYRLNGSVPLFKPDWRHGYPAFYFACTPGLPESGKTRDLQAGTLKCKEWVAKMSDINPNDHIVGAECVFPAQSRNHYELSKTYIATLAAEIGPYAQVHP